MIDKNGKPTTLQAGDILVFDTLKQNLRIIRFGFHTSSSFLKMNDEKEKLYLIFINHRDKIHEFLNILSELFNLYFKECPLKILPKEIIDVEDFIFAFEALSQS